MKTFLVALCLVGAVVAHHDHGKKHDFSKIPGCEKADDVKDIKAKTCCATMPEYKDNAALKECENSCEKEDHCCKKHCSMKPFVDSTGKFDPTVTKELIKKSVNNDASWPIDAIVDDCVAKAPAQLKEWEEKMAAYKANKTDKEDKKEHKKCDNSENFVIGHCIRRELVIQCPSWTESDSCTTLMAFAKSCPMYPFRDSHGKENKSVEKEGNNDDKESAKKSKREAANDEDISTKKGRKGSKKGGRRSTTKSSD